MCIDIFTAKQFLTRNIFYTRTFCNVKKFERSGMEEFEGVCCIREATMEIWGAATGEMYVRGSHATCMINMLLMQKKIWNSRWTIHHDVWQECGRSFCDEGVRLPHIACTIACIDHASCL